MITYRFEIIAYKDIQIQLALQSLFVDNVILLEKKLLLLLVKMKISLGLRYIGLKTQA